MACNMAWPPAQKQHAIEQMAQGASCETTGYEPKVTRPGMELGQRRESSLQRRAAQALGASGANALSTVPGNMGMVSGVSGGDLLAA